MFGTQLRRALDACPSGPAEVGHAAVHVLVEQRQRQVRCVRSARSAAEALGRTREKFVEVKAEEQHARQQGWSILAEWKDCVTVGCDPQRMGLGPVQAIRELFRRQQLNWDDIDTLEINEAFAAQVLACLRELDLSLDLNNSLDQRVRHREYPMQFNAEGGAIAMGHPLAASGARLLTHLAWKVSRGESQCAVAALCIGGGMGIASVLTAVND